MDDGRYKSGSTLGAKWGCASAIFVTLPIFIFLLLVDTLGDCAPDITCGKGFWSHVALPSAFVALAVGFVVRWAVNRWRSSGG